MRKHGFLKKLAVFVAAGSMALSLTGCGGMTLEKLMVEMDTALEGKELYEAVLALELDANMTADGEKQEITADIAVDVQTSSEPAALYLDMDIDADAAGESIKETMQIYAQEEDEAMVGYMHMDTLDIWSSVDLDMTAEDFNTSEESEEAEMELPEDIALAEETEIVENRESYVITCTLTGEDLAETDEDAMAEAETALSELGIESMELDFSSLTIPTTVYVDIETYLPIRIEMEIQGLNEIFNGVMDTVMDSMMTGIAGLEGAEDLGVDMSELEAEMGAMDMEMDITTAKLVVNGLGFDPVEVPTVPEEGKEAAAKQELITNQFTFEAAQADGSYIIQESGNAVKITIPEGYEAYDYGYNYVLATTDDATKEASYMMYYDMMGQDFAFYVEQAYVPSLKEEEIYVTHGIGPKIGNFETMYIECIDDITLYTAWAPVGDGWIYIEMYDYNDSELEEALTPIIEAVEEHQL